MSLISSTTSVCVYYAGLEIFREYAPTVTRALVSEVAKRQLECYIGTLIAGPSVFLMGMSLPFLTDRIEHLMGMSLRDRETVDVANWTRVATCIYFTRGDIFKIFVAISRRSPAQFAYDYGTDMIKAMVLDSACQKISKKTGRYAGNIVYAVASTKLMPNTSPFALSIANGLIYMITMIRNRFFGPSNTAISSR